MWLKNLALEKLLGDFPHLGLDVDEKTIIQPKKPRFKSGSLKIDRKERREPDLNRHGFPQRFSRPSPYQTEPPRQNKGSSKENMIGLKRVSVNDPQSQCHAYIMSSCSSLSTFARIASFSFPLCLCLIALFWVSTLPRNVKSNLLSLT